MENQTIEKIVHKYFQTLIYEDSTPIVKVGNSFATNPTKRVKWDFSHEDSTEECFVKNFGNPMASVECILTTFVIEKTEDKISIKIYHNRKKRVRGNKFFIKRKNVKYLTINKKTYDIYYGIFSKNRSQLSSIRRNSYISTLNFGEHVNTFFSTCKISKIDNRFDSYNDLNNLILKILRKELNHEDIKSYGDIFHWRLKKLGLKYSDNFKAFFEVNNHFTLKNIRKGSYKMVDAVMSYYNYEGKKIRSVLNQVNKFNPRGWEMTNILFDNPINEFTKELIIKIFEYPSSSWYGLGVYSDFSNWAPLTKKEKKCLKIIFETIINEDRNIDSLLDHLWFREQLITNYGHLVEFKAKTIKEFNEEHYSWTNELESYKVGIHYREYNQDFKNSLNKTIYGYDGVDYHINLLESPIDYIGESMVQNNCVRTYQDRDSIIVSIRVGDKESTERASVEYRVFKKENNLEYKRVQNLGKFNSKLNSSWDVILEQTDKIFENSLKYLKQDVYLYYETKKSINKYEFKPSTDGQFRFVGNNEITSLTIF